MKNLTLEEALSQHELDVAALEIWDRRRQLENLQKWLAEVKPLEQNKVEDLLKKIKQKGLVR